MMNARRAACGPAAAGFVLSLVAVLPYFRGQGADTIRGLVLISPAAVLFPPPPNFKLANNAILRTLTLTFLGPNEIARLMLRGAFWRDDRIPDGLVREYARCYAQPRALPVLAQTALQIFEELQARADRPERYAPIHCPTLLIWGERDPVIPQSVMQRLDELLPDCNCIVIPDCGHTPPEECPAQTLTLLVCFLETLHPSSRPASAP